MKKIIERERQLYKSSFQLRKMDLTGVDYEQAKKIREKQDDDYKRYLFFKGYINQLKKEDNKDESQTGWSKY